MIESTQMEASYAEGGGSKVAEAADLLRQMKSYADELSKLKKEIHRPEPSPPATTKDQLPSDEED